MSSSRDIDRLCYEFEAAWKSGIQPEIRDFLKKITKEHRVALLKELIPRDVECRDQFSTQPSAEDYAAFGDGAVKLAAKVIRELTSAPEFSSSDSANAARKAKDGDSGPAADSGSSADEPTFIGDINVSLSDTLDQNKPRLQKFESGQSDDSSDGESRIIGPYKLVKRIGKGGMGFVFLAEQEKPVRRQVALKLIQTGMDTKEVIIRFEAERQALAMMDHQNIAKVLDARTTDDHRPYFVMELVDGVHITDYCDEHRLSLNDRLELFMQTCRAIQHAHQKGIIHRDIKPGNVLVTQHDGRLDGRRNHRD